MELRDLGKEAVDTGPAQELRVFQPQPGVLVEGRARTYHFISGQDNFKDNSGRWLVEAHCCSWLRIYSSSQKALSSFPPFGSRPSGWNLWMNTLIPASSNHMSTVQPGPCPRMTTPSSRSQDSQLPSTEEPSLREAGQKDSAYITGKSRNRTGRHSSEFSECETISGPEDSSHFSRNGLPA